MGNVFITIKFVHLPIYIFIRSMRGCRKPNKNNLDRLSSNSIISFHFVGDKKSEDWIGSNYIGRSHLIFLNVFMVE